MRALCAVACWWLVAEFAVHDRLHGVVEVAETVAAFSTVSVLATDDGVRHGLQVRPACLNPPHRAIPETLEYQRKHEERPPGFLVSR